MRGKTSRYRSHLIEDIDELYETPDRGMAGRQEM
jgi:hypothetical protein